MSIEGSLFDTAYRAVTGRHSAYTMDRLSKNEGEFGVLLTVLEQAANIWTEESSYSALRTLRLLSLSLLESDFARRFMQAVRDSGVLHLEHGRVSEALWWHFESEFNKGNALSVRNLLTLQPRLIMGAEGQETVLHLIARFGAAEYEDPGPAWQRDRKALVDEMMAEIETMPPERRAEIVNARGKGGQTALHIACQWNEMTLVRWLVENGADVRAQDDEGRTPLHIICQEGHGQKLWLLLYDGAGTEREPLEGIPDRLGWAAGEWLSVRDQFSGAGGTSRFWLLSLLERYHNVMHWEDKQMLRECIQNTMRRAYCRAVDRGCLESASKLLDWGADINAQGDQGGTFFALAVSRGDKALAYKALEMGADVEAENEIEEAPYDYPIVGAATHGWIDLIGDLLQRGARTDVAGREGMSLLHLVVRSSCKRTATRRVLRCIEDLKKHGAAIDAVDENQETPKQLAQKLGAPQEILAVL